MLISVLYYNGNPSGAVQLVGACVNIEHALEKWAILPGVASFRLIN